MNWMSLTFHSTHNRCLRGRVFPGNRSRCILTTKHSETLSEPPLVTPAWYEDSKLWSKIWNRLRFEPELERLHVNSNNNNNVVTCKARRSQQQEHWIEGAGGVSNEFLILFSVCLILRCTDVIEVMFLCQMAAVASDVRQCPSAGRRRSVSDQRHDRTTTMSHDLILLRFTAVNMFLCIGANDARVRLKRFVSNPPFSVSIRYQNGPNKLLVSGSKSLPLFLWSLGVD